MVLNPWVILGIVLALGSGGTLLYVEGRKDGRALEVAAQAEARAAAELKAREIGRQTFRIQENKDASYLQLVGDLADAQRRLRNRPAVRLTDTPAACAGASPAALSAEDGAVSLGLAAEADRLRADYIACRQWVDAVTH